MKQLSLKEKARLYDEAIKKVNDFYEGKTKLYSDVDKTLNYLFPEFKESEDERIRKDIISFLRSKNGYMNPNEDWDFRNRWLPWLEKHGEQKVSVVEFNAKDWYVSKVDGKIYNAKFMKKASTNLARKLEIEKAAMSATGIIDREEWFIKGAEWADGNPSYISSEKQGEQNPAWSKEDENMLDRAIYMMEQLDMTKSWDDVYNWLKSIKEQAQSKQEWSAEDKRNFLDVTCIIDEVWSNQKVREEIDHSSEELESLWHWLYNIWQRVKYPQDTWKPSDEQMASITCAVQKMKESACYDSELVSLFDDLKKLKG